jgi:1-acyl-sn-glycerol-3-phosphate acyltransferase
MLIRRLGSTLFWIFLVVTSILLFPLALLIWALTVLFDRRLVLLHRFTCFWASLYSWLNPVWRVRIEGREKIAPNTAYVMVANHQSLLDILVLFRLFVHYKWVSKIENFRVPCIGWNMSLNRYIKLRRGDRQSIEQMMTACEQAVGEGNSIMMFPEGTRSLDGRLKQFKHGAFTIAQRMRVPILPIIVEGTADALPKRGFVLQGRHAIRIRVLDAIVRALRQPVRRSRRRACRSVIASRARLAGCLIGLGGATGRTRPDPLLPLLNLPMPSAPCTDQTDPAAKIRDDCSRYSVHLCRARAWAWVGSGEQIPCCISPRLLIHVSGIKDHIGLDSNSTEEITQ